MLATRRSNSIQDAINRIQYPYGVDVTPCVWVNLYRPFGTKLSHISSWSEIFLILNIKDYVTTA